MATKSSPSSHSLQRTWKGVVVSAKAPKTVVVRVDRTLTHPLYGKSYVRSLRYHVHDEKGSCREGDHVTFVACRPLSKTKRWRIVEA
jgi:small subunit ribosomal protein S17